MRVLSFLAMSIAAITFGMLLALPQTLSAASDRYTQAPGEFRQIGESQALGNLAPSIWETTPVRYGSTFTDSLFDSRSGAIGEADLDPNNAKLTREEKGPGAKVPEPGTLFLACAGLVGVARLSAKKMIRR